MSVLSRRGRATAALLAALCAAPVAARPAAAQYLAGFTYGVGIPSGDLRDFTDNTSFLGFTVEGRRFGSEGPLAFGFLFGYNEFYHSTTEPLPLGEVGTVSGEQYRHVMSWPMLLTAEWFPRRAQGEGGAQPFAGLGAGAYWVRQEFDIGAVLTTADNWQFGLMPQVGVAYPTGRGSFITLTGRYHIPLGGGDFLGGESKSFQSFVISVGVAYASF